MNLELKTIDWKNLKRDLDLADKKRKLGPWGCWHLRSNLTLELVSPLGWYEVPLDELESPMDMLFWTSHLARKRWVTSEILGDLQRALFATFTFCGSGHEGIRGQQAYDWWCERLVEGVARLKKGRKRR